MVRTPGFHPGSRSSILRRVTNRPAPYTNVLALLPFVDPMENRKTEPVYKTNGMKWSEGLSASQGRERYIFNEYTSIKIIDS